MRIISQDKLYDVPYEMVTINAAPASEGTYNIWAESPKKEYLLGKYKNEEKAKEVMENIQDAFGNNKLHEIKDGDHWMDYWPCFKMPKE